MRIPFVKTILPESFGYKEPIAMLVDVHRLGVDGGWMDKRAAAGVFKDFDVKPERGHSFIHLIAMGDSEYYGANRNSDAFLKEGGWLEAVEPWDGKTKRLRINVGNVQTHPTFEKFAKVYRHHINKDPAKSCGDVVKSAHNDEMSRVELMIKVKDDDWHDDLEKLASGQDLAFSMSCFPAGTPVRTSEGLRPIEELIPGQLVYTHTGAYSEITDIMVRPADALCRIDVVGMCGLPIYATEEHPFYAATYADVPKQSHLDAPHSAAFCRSHRDELHKYLRWVPAAQLGVGHYLAIPIRLTANDGLFCTLSENEARLMGYYMAEGSLIFNDKRACTVQFTCHTDDVAVQELEGLAPWTSVTYAAHALSEQCTVVSAHGTDVADRLYRMVGRASRKRTPSAIFASSESVRMAYLVGWFNGDGWQDAGGLHWSTVVSERALNLQQLLATLGIPSAITCIHHPDNRGTGIRAAEAEYVVTVSNEYSDRFANVPGCKAVPRELCGASKRRCFISGDYLMVPVGAVELVESEQNVYNISVAGDESYTAFNVAVHNCKVPFDVCSYCLHKAANRSEYCDHLKNHMSELTKEGVQICAVNDWMRYFDISRVNTPADRIAYGLLKAASGVPMSGAELADHMTLFPPSDSEFDLFADTKDTFAEKVAVLQKLSDIEKEIELTAPSSFTFPAHQSSMAFDPEVSPGLDDTMISRLVVSRNRIPDLLGALADVKISLSLEDFLKLVLGNRYGETSEAVDEAKSLLPGIFTRMLGSPMKALSGLDDFELGDSILPLGVRQRICDMVPTHSVDGEPVRRRMTIMVIRGRQPGELRKSATLVGISNKTLAERMATAYAMYKLALCQRMGLGNRSLVEMAVLQNYCQ